MKKISKYVPYESRINESVGSLKMNRVNRINRINRAGRFNKPLFEAVKADTIVDEDNIDSVIRKIKKVVGCKVCVKDGNLVCCETKRVIVRNVFNGRRTVDSVLDLVESFLDKVKVNKKDIKESVAERFASYRHLYESEEDSKEEQEEHKEDEDEKDDKDIKDSEDSEEDIPMTAVVLTVAKGDGSKLKDELIEAGIPDDDIDVIEEDDEDDKVKVDANSIIELKDFLRDNKGIDLEEKLGGEIIDDEDSDDDKDDKKEDDSKDSDDLSFGDDVDFDALFGADDDSSDEGK
jgi:hypothetical protein